MKDFYYILGVDANCTLEEIKDAYRKLSKKFHPDLNDGDKYFEERFKEIQVAYEILSDPARRSQYDNDLKNFRSQSTSSANRGQYYSQHSSNRSYGRRRFRIGATAAILILLGFVFAAYLVKYLIHSKTGKLISEPVVSASPVKPKKHHKKNRLTKNKISEDSVKQNAGKKIIKPVVPPLANKNKEFASANNKQTVLVSDKSTIVNKGYLYATTIHANATGIVNMRESDNFSSAVIETIPGNSRVFVVERGDVYYKVEFNGSIGYVPKWALQIK